MSRPVLCTVAEVIQTSRFNHVDEVGGEDVVNEAIEEAEAEIAGDFGDPVRKSRFTLSSTQLRYEFRNDDKETHRIDSVIIREDDLTRREYTEGDTASESELTYTKEFVHNTITFSQETVNAWDGRIVEVIYLPKAFHHLARAKAAIFILETSNVSNADSESPTVVDRLWRRVKRIESSLMPDGVAGSEDEKFYDPTLGEYIPQRRFWTI